MVPVHADEKVAAGSAAVPVDDVADTVAANAVHDDAAARQAQSSRATTTNATIARAGIFDARDRDRCVSRYHVATDPGTHHRADRMRACEKHSVVGARLPAPRSRRDGRRASFRARLDRVWLRRPVAA